MIKEIQERILVILYENPEKSVTLAQLPSLLTAKYNKTYDITELGFPKLKNFLSTMSDKIVIEEFQKNHIKVKLISNCDSTHLSSIKRMKKNKNNKRSKFLFSLNQDSANESSRKGFRTLKPNEFDKRCK